MTNEQAKSCEDAISREWLKTAIHNFYYGLKHIPTEEDIQAYIDVAPSVKPQEKTGHWITLKDEYGDVYEAVCSNCDSNGNHKWAFCPSCGAKMKEGD